MRDLKRNQVPFWYSLYLGKEPVLKNGFETGQYKEKYSEPIQAKARISRTGGDIALEEFGISLRYDGLISSVQDLPIDEYSRLWVDVSPNEKADNYDYKVKRVAKDLNSHVWAIEKVVRDGYKTN